MVFFNVNSVTVAVVYDLLSGNKADRFMRIVITLVDHICQQVLQPALAPGDAAHIIQRPSDFCVVFSFIHHLEGFSDQRCFFLVDDPLVIPAVLVTVGNPGERPTFKCMLLMCKSRVLTDAVAFLFRNRCKDVHNECAFLVLRIQVLLLENDVHTEASKLSDHLYALRHVSGKAGNAFDRQIWRALSDQINTMIKACQYTGTPESYLSIDTADVVVGGRHKKTQGKGYRAFLNTLMLFNLMKYLEANGKYASHFLFLDSPILSLKERKYKIAENELATVGMRESLIQYIIDNCGQNQVIIAENELPENVDYSKATLITFSQEEGEGLRYGFLKTPQN